MKKTITPLFLSAALWLTVLNENKAQAGYHAACGPSPCDKIETIDHYHSQYSKPLQILDDVYDTYDRHTPGDGFSLYDAFRKSVEKLNDVPARQLNFHGNEATLFGFADLHHEIRHYDRLLGSWIIPENWKRDGLDKKVNSFSSKNTPLGHALKRANADGIINRDEFIRLVAEHVLEHTQEDTTYPSYFHQARLMAPMSRSLQDFAHDHAITDLRILAALQILEERYYTPDDTVFTADLNILNLTTETDHHRSESPAQTPNP